MQTLTISQMKGMVSHIALAQSEPVMFWGPPGAGKTEGIYQAAEEHNATVCDCRLGQYDSIDLRGIPVPSQELKQTVWYAPITLPFKGNPEFDNDARIDPATGKRRPIILFLDELNQAAPAVFGVAMQLINERRIGEFELLDEVAIVCAGNRDSDRAVTNRMPTTVCNRLTHAEIIIDPDAWCFWAQEAGLPPIFVAFIQFRKALLDRFKEDGIEGAKKAFATPRTWAKAAKYFADPKMPTDIKQAAMAGAVGEGPSAEFWGFHDVWSKMIPMASIEKDPMGVKLPEEASMRYAITVAVSGVMTKKNVAPFHAFLMRMDPEFAILAWQLAMTRDQEITATKEFIDFSKKYRAVFSRS
jgi:hypothetical protein